MLPRILQRFYLPTAITSVALGMLSGMGLGLFVADPTVRLLSTLGISALFLFAGLDVDLGELRLQRRFVLQHVAIMVATLGLATWLARLTLHLPLRPAALVALALITPSAGFIVDSLGWLGVSDRERFWIKTKSVAWELVALVVLFVTLQSTTATRLLASFVALAALIGILPVVFRVFAARVAPFAPKSEFAFLLMVAVVSAYATRALGAYYLIGAFVVGMVGRRFRQRLPAMASEEMLHAVEVFASFFVPFYFFHAGLGIRREDVGIGALTLGLGFLALLLPVRVLLVVVHRRLGLGETFRGGLRIATAIIPTLVFTLVIAGILRDRFGVSQAIFGGLTVYALVNTIIPGLWLRVPPPAFEELHFDLIETGDAGKARTAGPAEEGAPAPRAGEAGPAR